MATPTTTFKLKGPMFETPTQVSLGFAEADNRGLLDLATIEGSNKVLDQLYGDEENRHGRITGELRRHVGAAVVRDGLAVIAAGEQQGRQNLIYSSWVEGISSRNRARPGFPGYQMFENAHRHIDNNPKLYEDYIGAALVEAFD